MPQTLGHFSSILEFYKTSTSNFTHYAAVISALSSEPSRYTIQLAPYFALFPDFVHFTKS